MVMLLITSQAIEIFMWSVCLRDAFIPPKYCHCGHNAMTCTQCPKHIQCRAFATFQWMYGVCECVSHRFPSLYMILNLSQQPKWKAMRCLSRCLSVSVVRSPGPRSVRTYSLCLSVSAYARCAMIPMRICTAIDHADDLIGMDTPTRTVTETETNVIDSRRRRLQCAN